MIKSIKEDMKGSASIPVIIGIITVVVFVGIVVAAINQEKNRPRVNEDLERAIQEGGGVIPDVGGAPSEVNPSVEGASEVEGAIDLTGESN